MAFTSLRVAVRRTRILPHWLRRADAAVGRAVNGRHAHPAVDRFWGRLSGFADKGVLWWTLAGVLAVTRRRRTAARGLLSLLVASALTNVIAKKVFGGDRPLLADVPIGRHLPKPPITPSFPSGHSASGAAFATGVALESPRLGAAIVPVALGVGYSRLHTGAHWISDVVGGLALGATVAAAGALLVRPQPGVAPGPPPTGEDRPLPAAPDGEGVFVVVNRSSGTSVMRFDPTAVIAERLPRAELHELHDETAAEAVHRALARSDPPRILGVCGGDGSVAAVAHEARAAGLPLFVVPGGTFNHFARTAGAASVDLAVDALQRGEGVRADVAELAFGDEPPITVLNTASVGVYPDFVAERERLEERYGKWPAALISAVRVLMGSEPVTIVMNGRRARVWTLFVGVGANDPGTPAPLQRRRLDGGVLDVRMLHAGSRARAAASLAFGRRTSAMLRRLRLLPERIESFRTESLEVIVRPRHGQPPGFAHDGEVSLEAAEEASAELAVPGYRTTLQIVPAALDVYRPATGSRDGAARNFTQGAATRRPARAAPRSTRAPHWSGTAAG
ncbi:phosphatase PAP2 family protein [Agromyces sp. ISL-38]|uniref:bifunctional phosphatase PAP2/diacylglycerol kinase family protein n=1 Tax=Agromyces sp. ISL-38 TaxID=2819107 RepID=UPI0027E09FAF|nr:phosphatase PAP2 family protein [Agromyces sp. ISL-38]